jgi:hypothetical protein
MGLDTLPTTQAVRLYLDELRNRQFSLTGQSNEPNENIVFIPGWKSETTEGRIGTSFTGS